MQDNQNYYIKGNFIIRGHSQTNIIKERYN